MTFDEFSTLFQRLAQQLNHDADAEQIQAYFDALSDLKYEFVHDAAAHIARTVKWFPKTSEWREVALHLEQNKLRSEAAGQRSWQVECDLCDDCGWRAFDCAGDDFCGRPKPHLPHRFVKPCDCRATNHTFQRHHQQA